MQETLEKKQPSIGGSPLIFLDNYGECWSGLCIQEAV